MDLLWIVSWLLLGRNYVRDLSWFEVCVCL